MSLSLYGVPDGQQKGQSHWPCPSVYSPATALRSLSSVALSSAPAFETLAQRNPEAASQCQSHTQISSGFLNEATNLISSGFLREATGEEVNPADRNFHVDVRAHVSSLATMQRHNNLAVNHSKNH